MKTLSFIPPPVRSLIIDDEKDICYLLGNILTRKNIENDYANSVADGRRILQDQYFDLIFLDNYLPDGKGIDFIPYLKSAFPRIKIILITAYVDLATDDKVNEEEIECFLLKPLHADSVNDAIDHFLSNKIKSYHQ